MSKITDFRCLFGYSKDKSANAYKPNTTNTIHMKTSKITPENVQRLSEPELESLVQELSRKIDGAHGDHVPFSLTIGTLSAKRNIVLAELTRRDENKIIKTPREKKGRNSCGDCVNFLNEDVEGVGWCRLLDAEKNCQDVSCEGNIEYFHRI